MVWWRLERISLFFMLAYTFFFPLRFFFLKTSFIYCFLLLLSTPLLASQAAFSTSDLENSPISFPASSTTGRRRTLRDSSVRAAASAASPPRTTSGSEVMTSLTEAAAPFEAATCALKNDAQSPPGAGKMPLGATSGMSRDRRSKSETTPIWGERGRKSDDFEVRKKKTRAKGDWEGAKPAFPSSS